MTLSTNYTLLTFEKPTFEESVASGTAKGNWERAARPRKTHHQSRQRIQSQENVDVWDFADFQNVLSGSVSVRWWDPVAWGVALTLYVRLIACTYKIIYIIRAWVHCFFARQLHEQAKRSKAEHSWTLTHYLTRGCSILGAGSMVSYFPRVQAQELYELHATFISSAEVKVHASWIKKHENVLSKKSSQEMAW